MEDNSNSNTYGKIITFPPGPSEIFPYRLALKFISNPLPILKDITDKYGDISHFKFGPKLHVFLINNSYLIENILVKHNSNFIKSPGLRLAKRVLGNGLITNEGDTHGLQRRLVQPAFNRDKLKIYGKIITDHCIEYINNNWKDGMILDVHKEMTKLTLSIISKILFGSNTITKSDIDKISDSITIIIEYINKLRIPFLRFIEKLPLPLTRKYKQALNELDNLIYVKIRESRKNLKDITEVPKYQSQMDDDMLSILIRSMIGGKYTWKQKRYNKSEK